ncbi:aldehyde dehydrogenase family protein, partial [Siminovitchia fortis]|uniref:aldehyde dehydrogenase family protein n=1 Tax=Siminovitchia fortis TaxID=254758 RepID=UPI00119EDAAA
GVVNVVRGWGGVGGEAIMGDKHVDKVGFRGWRGVGRRVMKEGGDEMKGVRVEVGGKWWGIILEDGDLREGIEGGFGGRMYKDGENCSGWRRV